MRALAKLAAAGMITCAAFGLTASAQASVQASPALNQNAHLVHVGLNPATCGTLPGKKSGEVNVHSNAVLNRTQFNISVRGALPKTTYAVDIRCTLQIGTLTTNHKGNGTAKIMLKSALPAGATFFVDLSVPNGGAGTGGYGDTFIAGPFKFGVKGKSGKK